VTVALLEGVDWEVVALFAALVLLEGLRRVPAGALIVRGRGPGDWRPAATAEPSARWRLVSCWSPIAPGLVLPPLEGAPPMPSDVLAARVAVVRRATPWLAWSGALALAALVLGLPLASARLGAFGFFAGVGVVLGLALVTASVGALTLRRLGQGMAYRRGQILGWCSPFASGRVLEEVYQTALAGASPAQAVRALSGDLVFAAWARSRAYDFVRGGSPDPDLAAAADTATLAAIVASPPPTDWGGRSYCPRCAAAWIMVAGPCPSCGVPVVSVRADGSSEVPPGVTA
jgi:hypothetical protein